MTAERVWAVGAELGEGPMWHADALWFTDIKRRRVHRFDPSSGEGRSWEAPDQVSFVLPRADGGLIAGLKTGLHQFDPASGRFEHFLTVEPELPDNRLNDAQADAAGRLWFGSMDDGEAAATGSLWRFDHRGLHRADGGIAITNGPTASPDGRTFYHTDTVNRLIHAYDVTEDGGLSNRRVFAEIEPGAGNPDGSTVDGEGRLWVGLWGGWGVRVYGPDGAVVGFHELPTPQVTKVAFGGPDLRDVYVTTAAKGLPEDRREGAGDLYRLRSDAPGLPQNLIRS